MRNVINLNQNWKFIQQDAGLPESLPADWNTVQLPHSWNAIDGQDGNGSYDRGRYWYAKTFETPKQPLAGGKVYVEILAAGQQMYEELSPETKEGNRICKRYRGDLS